MRVYPRRPARTTSAPEEAGAVLLLRLGLAFDGDTLLANGLLTGRIRRMPDHVDD
jgi:hypothetical protein